MSTKHGDAAGIHRHSEDTFKPCDLDIWPLFGLLSPKSI